MKIWIDADAAPREVKEMVFRASARLKVEVTLVANQSIWAPKNSLITSITVRDGANMADKYLVEHASAGDIAITADVPLAADLVAKKVFVIDPRGIEYDDRNVASRLGARDLADAARGAGFELSGPPPYSSKDKSAFASALDRTLTKAIKSSQKAVIASAPNDNAQLP
jgi:uncharacterized protein YaiI (UPF0178 family)